MKKSINIPEHIFVRIQKLEGQSFTDNILGLVKIGLKKLNEEPEKPPEEPIEDDFGLVMFSTDNHEPSFDEMWFSK